MNTDIKAQWVAALRSGEYQQVDHALRTDSGYCCLGVLCDLHAQTIGRAWGETLGGFAYLDEIATLPRAVIDWSGVRDLNPNVHTDDRASVPLATLNDAGYTFAEIADLIEAQL